MNSLCKQYRIQPEVVNIIAHIFSGVVYFFEGGGCAAQFRCQNETDSFILKITEKCRRYCFNNFVFYFGFSFDTNEWHALSPCVHVLLFQLLNAIFRLSF